MKKDTNKIIIMIVEEVGWNFVFFDTEFDEWREIRW